MLHEKVLFPFLKCKAKSIACSITFLQCRLLVRIAKRLASARGDRKILIQLVQKTLQFPAENRPVENSCRERTAIRAALALFLRKSLQERGGCTKVTQKKKSDWESTRSVKALRIPKLGMEIGVQDQSLNSCNQGKWLGLKQWYGLPAFIHWYKWECLSAICHFEWT